MTKYEYRTVWATADPEEIVNDLANEGWRLHTVITDGEHPDGYTRFMAVMEREVSTASTHSSAPAEK